MFTFTSLCCPFLSLLLLVHHFFLFVYRCLLPSFLCPVSALAFSSPCFLSRLSGLQLLFFTFSFCPLLSQRYWRLKVQACFNGTCFTQWECILHWSSVRDVQALFDDSQCFHTVHIHPQVRVLYLTDAAGQAKIEVKCKNKKHQVLLPRCLPAADTETLHICSTLLDNSAPQLYLQGLQLAPHWGGGPVCRLHHSIKNPFPSDLFLWRSFIISQL